MCTDIRAPYMQYFLLSLEIFSDVVSGCSVPLRILPLNITNITYLYYNSRNVIAKEFIFITRQININTSQKLPENKKHQKRARLVEKVGGKRGQVGWRGQVCYRTHTKSWKGNWEALRKATSRCVCVCVCLPGGLLWPDYMFTVPQWEGKWDG